MDVKETAGTEIPAAVAEETTTEEDAILTVAVAEESVKMTVAAMMVKGEEA